MSNAAASVLGFHCNLRDGMHAALRGSCVVIIFNCNQSAKELAMIRLIIDTVC